MRPLHRALGALALCLAPAAGTAQEASVDEGGFAPPARWANAGGSASRSGLSFSRALRREPVEAWSVTVRGTIEGEPRVFDGNVVVGVNERGNRRSLQILELGTGRTLVHQVLPATTPLEPALWADRIAVRPSRERVDLYRVRASRLFLLRSIRAQRSISAPLIVEGQLYLRVDDRVVRYDLDRRDPVWTTAEGGVYRGDPSVRGDGVFALRYAPEGRARVVALAREDGRVLSEADAGHHGGEVPGPDAQATITVLETTVFVDYPLPVPSSAGRSFGVGRFAHEGTRFTSDSAALSQQLAPATDWGEGWLVLEDGERGVRWITAERDAEGSRVQVLADARNHPELTEVRVQATRTGDVVYLGGLAADLSSRAILWRRTAPRFRPVPVEGMLLVVEEDAVLTALVEEPRYQSAVTARARTDDQKLEDEVAAGYAQLAHRSLRLGDAKLTGRLIHEAVRRGARGRLLDGARDGLERLIGLRPANADPRRLRGLLEEEAALVARPEEELFVLARGTRDLGLQRAYLRAILERTPGHPEANVAVGRMIPGDAPVVGELDAASWLDFLDVHARTPVSFLTLDAETPRGPEQDLLRRESRRWRPDVHGLRSERLFVIATPGSPGAVARCLEVGEFVCDVLEEVFGQRARTSPHPMTLLLYDTQAEYVQQSRGASSGPEMALGWTAGHYSTEENLSRMFVPEDDDALERLLHVYAHELTHHWLGTQPPFASRSASPALPYWVVEGFATMIEEFRLDPRAGTWDPHNPRADSLDVVANAEEGQLLPWSSVLTSSYRDFGRLSAEQHTSVPLTWRLGVRAHQSQIQLFYAQSGAVCHYLYNASPEDRARLLAYLEAWYRQESSKLDARRAFGLDPEELGRRVVEHARETVGVE
jgi:hypothetical protein